MSAKKLIVNADDFGQSKGINKGIVQSFKEGILTSASLMVRYPAAVEAAAYAKNNPFLGIGLHVDLGEWRYTNGGWEFIYEVVSLDNREEVKKEVKRQLEMFFSVMGRKPTHIDSHQHVHLRENISPVFIEVAQSLNVNLRTCGKEVKYCGDFYGQNIDGSAFHQAISVESLQQIIAKLPEGYTEMACHPGLDVDVDTMYIKEREIEVRSLCNKQIKEAINKQNIELCSFEDVYFNRHPE